MPLRIADERSFTAPVETSDGQDFRAEFVILSDEDLSETAAQGVEAEKAIMRRIVRRLSEIVDEAGEEIPHSPDLLEQVIGFADLRIALLRAYNRGRIEARRGN